MKKIIIAALVAASLTAACAADPPAAPVAQPAAPAADSCEATHDKTPCTLTNQQALIEILRLSMTNQVYPNVAPPQTWEDMMLPPGVSKPPPCPACAEGAIWAKDAIK
jgi:hypothetical protein